MSTIDTSKFEIELKPEFNFDPSKFNMSIKSTVLIEDNYDFTEVLVQDFDDDYHEEKDESLILYNKAKTLFNQYFNYGLYLEAMDVYEEYMETLYEKYGGKKHFKKLFKSGLIDEFIPTKPILKRTYTIKNLIKYGIFNSNFIGNLSKVQKAKLIEYVNQLSKEEVISILNQSQEPYDITYNDLFIIKDDREKMNLDSLKISMMKLDKKRDIGGDPDTLLDYFGEEIPYDYRRRPTLTEMCASDFDLAEFNEKYNGIKNTEANKLTDEISGRFVNRAEAERYALKKCLLEGLGFDMDEDLKNKPCYKKKHKSKIKDVDTKVVKYMVRSDTAFKKSVKEVASECSNDAVSTLMSAVSEYTHEGYVQMHEYHDGLLDSISDKQFETITKKYGREEV